jgi:hypothetical protein
MTQEEEILLLQSLANLGYELWCNVEAGNSQATLELGELAGRLMDVCDDLIQNLKQRELRSRELLECGVHEV